MKNTMEELREMLCTELDEIAAKGEMNAGDLQTIHTLTDTIKNIDKIEMLDEGDYSGADGDWIARGNYGRGRSYRNGTSYGRHYVRGHYSMDDGREFATSEIERLMRGNISTQEKQTLERALKILRES